jgi:hypothetical protein
MTRSRVVLVTGATDGLSKGVALELARRGVMDPSLDGVTGRFYDSERESRANQQAYDPAARRKLRTLSNRLID